MEEISFKGENYVKASVLADKYGYTSDYVGQLCRSDQVKATLVGRSWYVSEESLLEHRKGRYRSTLAKSKEMVRKLAEERAQHVKPTNIQRVVRYENDDGDLFPALSQRSEVHEPEPSFEVEPESKEMTSPAPEEEVVLSQEPETDTEVVRSVPITKYKRPAVRTIPAFAASEISYRTDNRYQQHTQPRHKREMTVRRGSLVPALMVALFLIGEILAVSAALGLEKRLTVNSDNTEVVMYGFEPEMVAASIMSLWKY
jgi:hypothetical protein